MISSGSGNTGRERRRDGRRALGSFAEGVAAGYLERHGYRLRERNVHLRVGEIDIVAEHEGVTVFVEVRARHEGDLGSPLASLNRTKQRRMRLCAEQFLVLHPDMPQEARIDVIGISLDRFGRVTTIDLVQNAVEGAA